MNDKITSKKQELVQMLWNSLQKGIELMIECSEADTPEAQDRWLNKTIEHVRSANCLAQQLQNELLGIKDPNKEPFKIDCRICGGDHAEATCPAATQTRRFLSGEDSI